MSSRLTQSLRRNRMIRGAMGGRLTIFQTLALMLAWVIVPWLIGSGLLVYAHWDQQRLAAEESIGDSTEAFASALDQHIELGATLLNALAVHGAIDSGDWAHLHAYAKEVVRDYDGHVVGIVDRQGQLLFNTAVPYGRPLVNLWEIEARNEDIDWNGVRLPLSSQGMSRRAFETANVVFSDLYFGVSVNRPSLALAVPVRREGAVAYALVMSYPAAGIQGLLDRMRLPASSAMSVTDKAGRLIAARGTQATLAGDVASEQTTSKGYTVRLSVDRSHVLAVPWRVTAAWGALVAACLAISALAAFVFSSRIGRPLRALAAQILPPSRLALTVATRSRIAEINALSAALRAARHESSRVARSEASRRALEQEQAVLRASEAHLRRVLDSLFAFVGVLDLDGTLLEANLPPVERAGMARGDVIGKPFWECYWWNYSPEVQQRLKLAIESARSGEKQRYDVQVRQEEGRHVTIDVQLAPLRDSAGRITFLVPSAVDVQLRVQTAADFDAQRRLLDATLDATPAGIMVSDARGRVIRMNRANEALWGVAPECEDVLDYTVFRGWWTEGDHRGTPLAARDWPLARALATGQAVTATLEIEPFGQHEAARKFVIMSAAPVLDAGGHVVAGVVVQTDITQQHHAQAALLEADRQKDIFLATLAHELRNPLAPIRMAAEIIRHRAPDEPSVVRARQAIERQVLHMSRLVDDLLDASRVTVGSISLQMAVTSLKDLVASAVDVTRAGAGGRDMTLHLPPDDPLEVEGDATRLSQAVLNVVHNAVKFTGPDGHIRVTAVRDGASIRIEVTDDGIGLRPQALERIFGMFVQEEPSGLAGNQGLGIGLALARRVARLHGGDLHAGSAGPGCGSTFTFVLPACAREPSRSLDTAASPA